jgi:pimeloyl-ACP methyl ester carboxylesterase
VGIAAAPDFTHWGFSEPDKEVLVASGELRRPHLYGAEAELTTLAFWRSGEQLKLLHRAIAYDGPVRLLHGDADEEVPTDIAFKIKDSLRSNDVQVTVVKGGTHRLSESSQLDLLRRTVLHLAFGDTDAT